MSNILAPWVRPWGALPLNIGLGPIVDGVENQHLWFDDDGKIYAVLSGVINHYGAAMPFDVNGRLVCGEGPIDYWDQDIPFTLSGEVAIVQLAQSHWDQGLAFADTGHIISNDIPPPPGTPVWSKPPNQYSFEYELPETFDVSAYVSDGGTPITGFALIGAPFNFSIDGSGVVTCGVGTAPAAHLITVRATNAVGDSDTTFTWTVATGDVPTWNSIPNKNTRENLLPVNYDVSPYLASTGSGPILSYDLVAPPAGFTINAGTGVITAADGLALAAYPISVTATNGVGVSLPSDFVWTIQEELLTPSWDTIPDREDEEQTLPQPYDVTGYVTSNSGSLYGWSLVSPPTGFSISGGIITAAAGTSVAAHSITVRVGNDTGFADSDPFTWTVLEEPLPPQWQTIPNQSDREDTLPQTLDTSPYVTSNAGALHTWSLPGAPVGFTIDQSGEITVAAGTAVMVYGITVRVSNDVGSSDQSFNWDILEERFAPMWGTVPNKVSPWEDGSTQYYDVSIYVTSNDGQALFNWNLLTPPAGFSISSSGVIAMDRATAGVAVHPLQVNVSNATGNTDSNAFTWELQEELLLPQWQPLPDVIIDDADLPYSFDLKPYVTSNAGPLVNWGINFAGADGWSMNSSTGVVTANVGADTGDNVFTWEVYNDLGRSFGGQRWVVNQTVFDDYQHDFGTAVLGDWVHTSTGAATVQTDVGLWHEVNAFVAGFCGAQYVGDSYSDTGVCLGLEMHDYVQNYMDDNDFQVLSRWDFTNVLQTTPPGPHTDGGILAVTLSDIEGGSIGRMSQLRVVTEGITGRTRAFQTFLRKNGTRIAGFKIENTTNSENYHIKVNPVDGTWAVIEDTIVTLPDVGAYVISRGDWWMVLMWCTVETDTNNMEYWIQPAVALDMTPGGTDASATGSNTFWQPTLLAEHSINQPLPWIPSHDTLTTGHQNSRAVLDLKGAGSLPADGLDGDDLALQLVFWEDHAFSHGRSSTSDENVTVLRLESDDESEYIEIQIDYGRNEFQFETHEHTGSRLAVGDPVDPHTLIDMRFNSTSTNFNIRGVSDPGWTIFAFQSTWTKKLTTARLNKPLWNYGFRKVLLSRIGSGQFTNAEVDTWNAYDPPAPILDTQPQDLTLDPV